MKYWKHLAGWAIALALASSLTMATLAHMGAYRSPQDGGISAVLTTTASIVERLRDLIATWHLITLLAAALAAVEMIKGIRDIARLWHDKTPAKASVSRKARWLSYSAVCICALIPGVYYTFHAIAA